MKVRKVGKSFTISIPHKLAKFIKLREGEIANWTINSEKELIIDLSK